MSDAICSGVEVTSPTLLLNEDVARNNIRMMAKGCRLLGVKLIPHFKTHQSREIGEWFREEYEELECIAVSSVKMAKYFAESGWKHIFIAFPLNVLEIGEINTILRAATKLTLMLVDHSVAEILDANLISPVDVMIEVDTGYERSGVAVGFDSHTHSYHSLESSLIAASARNAKQLNLLGLYSHPGHTYHAKTVDEIQTIWKEASNIMNDLKQNLKSQELCDDGLVIRMGDTPGCSRLASMSPGDCAGVSEVVPGNFVFYDVIMSELGVCEDDNIAVCVAAPIVSKCKDTRKVILHCGAVHLSKDHCDAWVESRGEVGVENIKRKVFGKLVCLRRVSGVKSVQRKGEGVVSDPVVGWETEVVRGAYVSSISQEHGVCLFNEGVSERSDQLFNKLKTGDLIGVLPAHSCLCCNSMRGYHCFNKTQLRLVDHCEGRQWGM
eukprot:GHVN01076493.1.p1 GENE.GHVN01076493.1~~GHVN01076493.1.p1  ORF type:complete len:438 (+),score=49.63 GHVN01076493.1:1136-2449(+)